jgi:hypothetical protein
MTNDLTLFAELIGAVMVVAMLATFLWLLLGGRR